MSDSSSGVDGTQNTLELAQESLSGFGRSAKERLEEAYRNGQEQQSGVRDRHQEAPSQAFSDLHRSFARHYTAMDADWLEYDPEAGEVYLIYETICVKNGTLDETVDERQSLRPFKRKVYEWLDEQLDCPIYVVWHTESCDRFYVRNVSEPQTPLRELKGSTEYQNWLDEFRPSSEVA